MNSTIEVNGRRIGIGCPVYIIAEMSANHNHDFDHAAKIIRVAKEAGADAVKLQTYTPDTITINCNNKYFQVGKGTTWEGYNLYRLYGEAYTPWEWHPKLKAVAEDCGIDIFSTPFDSTAVDYLENLGVPAYKIASFELVDIPLIRRIAQTGKPIIMSTGMATEAEIQEAVQAVREGGCHQLALLKCTSAYPALPEDMNLRTIPKIGKIFGAVPGLSDHTLSSVVPVVAVALGVCIIEKHITLARSEGGPDSAFSLEPNEFKSMVKDVRTAEKTLGKAKFLLSKSEEECRFFRRSLFVVKDMKAGEIITDGTVRSIRPGQGLHTRYFNDVMGKKTSKQIKRGTPLDWNMLEKEK